MRTIQASFQYFAVALFTLLVVKIIAKYWNFLGAGINSSANGMAIVVIYFPFAVITLLTTMLVVSIAARRRQYSPGMELSCVLGSLMLVSIAQIAWEIWRLRSYPCDSECSSWSFLPWLIANPF